MTGHSVDEDRVPSTVWEQTFDRSPVGILLCDHHGRVIAANAALCALIGSEKSDVLGRVGATLFHPEERVASRPDTVERPPGGVTRTERRCRRRDGQQLWVLVSARSIAGRGGEPWTLAHVEDITEHKRAEQALAETEAALRSIAEVVAQIQAGGDARRTVVEAAVSLARADVACLLELSDDEIVVEASTDPALVGLRLALSSQAAAVTAYLTAQSAFLADARQARAPQILSLTGAQSVYSVPVRAAGTTIGVLAVGWRSPIVDIAGPRARVVRLIADHSGVALRQAAMFRELTDMALTDSLTGLPNRRHWDQRLEHLLAPTRCASGPMAVALVDLDHFKTFNDTHGHPAGDDFLRRFATAAQLAVRSVDTVARLGGDEFAVALPGCWTHEAQQVLARVASSVPLRQTCSIGVAAWDGLQSAEELTAGADRALYLAKACGRDQIRFA